MIDNKEIYEESLGNHIYFSSTIRYFCTIIGLTFYRNNQDYIDRAITLGRRATGITDLTIKYMKSLKVPLLLESPNIIGGCTQQKKQDNS